jgi:hypothetical protein
MNQVIDLRITSVFTVPMLHVVLQTAWVLVGFRAPGDFALVRTVVLVFLMEVVMMVVMLLLLLLMMRQVGENAVKGKEKGIAMGGAMTRSGRSRVERTQWEDRGRDQDLGPR